MLGVMETFDSCGFVKRWRDRCCTRAQHLAPADARPCLAWRQVTTSRKYEDRLETLENVRSAGISVCAGGIIGLGEGEKDRIGLIHQLATLPAHPESVPINRLVAVKGTPFEVRWVAYVAQFLRVVHDAQR